MNIKTYGYGFPRLGSQREFKKLIEGFWQGTVSETEMWQGLDGLEKERKSIYKKCVDKFPSGEMTLYDQMLDTAIMLGFYRPRNLDEYFDLCRGKNALEMTKWFNTNYHYMVPEIKRIPKKLKAVWGKLKGLKKGDKGLPYLIGPFTFLKLAKGYEPERFADYLLKLAELYKDLLEDFDSVHPVKSPPGWGAAKPQFNRVHIDEPAFVLELTREEIELIKKVYAILGGAKTKIYLFTYYASVDFLPQLYELPVKAIGLDFVHGTENLDAIRKYGFPKDKILIAGLVDGRNVWRTDIFKAVAILKELAKYADSLMVSNAGPLYHLPLAIESETLEQFLLDKLSFAGQRLIELNLIKRACGGDTEEAEKWVKNITSPYGANQKVQERIQGLRESDFTKPVSYKKRAEIQKEVLNLPPFPTTTIGSFPQTPEVRKKRSDWRAGRIARDEYEAFIKEKISDLIKFQEEIGLDVLVHGEFERTDMVEFFAEKLDGVATTRNGWIISYGTRCYRPPIIYGDISRPAPMTVKEIAFAQSLTEKPVKGMLTGPVTIIAWSYVREDIPVREVAYQIALAEQDEIKDYEAANIKIVQIDEPAFREKAPLKKRDWNDYFDWAVKSFRLASKSRPETQVHTHMCYSEFGEIIDEIREMDFDVISIEAARSRGDIIEVFRRVGFDRRIGLGVWDIHSPAVPTLGDMKKVANRVLKVIPPEFIWINPDCGLKTRGWKETIQSLKNLVKMAGNLRKTHKAR